MAPPPLSAPNGSSSSENVSTRFIESSDSESMGMTGSPLIIWTLLSSFIGRGAGSRSYFCGCRFRRSKSFLVKRLSPHLGQYLYSKEGGFPNSRGSLHVRHHISLSLCSS